MPQTEVRVVGSGFTTFNYRGKALAFCDTIMDGGQSPVGSGEGGGQGYEVITPIGWTRPREIVTTRVIGAGKLTLTFRELWNQNVWNQLAGLENVARAGTITDIYEALAQDPSVVTCTKIIKPPGFGLWRVITYMNCQIVAIDDKDTISTGAMSVAKTIDIIYTHKTAGTAAPSF